jgi:hypothetical protein
MSYPPFRALGSYYCIFGMNPFGPHSPAYNPIAGYAPMGLPIVPWAVGTYGSPTQLTCLAPSWQYPLLAPGDPPVAANGPVDVVIVDQNPTGLPIVGGHLLNVVFYQPAAWSWLQPTILSLVPTSGSGYGFDFFVVTGQNFYPGHVGVTGVDVVPNRLRFGPYEVDADYVNVTTLTGHTPGHFACTTLNVDVTVIPPRLPSWLSQESAIHQPESTLPAAFTYDSTWWKYTGIAALWAFETCELFVSSGPDGDKFVDRLPPFEWDWRGPDAPGPGWTPTTPPDPNGWWTSVSEFRGDVFVVAHGRPANPRTWADLAGFATGSAAMLGGSPGLATTFRNRLVYAATGYTVGTDAPPIRMFDGTYDRDLTTLPPTAAGPARAVVSVLTANGTIYVSSWDAGTDGATWTGRVFRLDIETAALTPLGGAFPAGHLPYALAWHNGMLWCGTHRGATPTAAGKLFSLRPELQETAVWVEDHDLGSVRGVAALCSFHGTLYVGTTDGAGVFAALITRASDGTYATADLGTGGAAQLNNGYLALTVFKDALYASYWNGDTPAIARIRKTTDGVAWTTVYTGVAATLRPFIAFGIDHDDLFAIGGGQHLTAAVLSTDGSVWTDLTAQLPETDKTALPAFGGIGY